MRHVRACVQMSKRAGLATILRYVRAMSKVSAIYIGAKDVHSGELQNRGVWFTGIKRVAKSSLDLSPVQTSMDGGSWRALLETLEASNEKLLSSSLKTLLQLSLELENR